MVARRTHGFVAPQYEFPRTLIGTDGPVRRRYAGGMTRLRHRASRNLGTLALQAPFVAAHRLTHELATGEPLEWWFRWLALAWEKWFAGAEVAAASST